MCSAKLWRGNNQENNDVYLYLPGSGGGPDVYLDMTTKELKKSTFAKLHRDYTWIVVDTSKVKVSKKGWKACMPVWYHKLARELGRQVAEKGGRLCFMGYSRGAFWGVSLLMENPGLFQRAVLIAPYVTGNVDTSQEAMDRLSTNIKDTLVLVCASKNDKSCKWEEEAAFLNGMQNLSPRSWHVHVEDGPSHDELRQQCILGDGGSISKSSELILQVLYTWDPQHLTDDLPVNT